MTAVVIVGAGLAAVRTAEQLRRHGHTGPITIIGAEAHPPYDRPPLSKDLLRGEVTDTADIALKPPAFYAEQCITLRLGVAAHGVDTAARTVTLADGAVLGYDTLVIATGLAPRVPAWPALGGVHVLRSFDQAAALRRQAVSARRAVVVGAGFIGCEVAAGLRRLGVDVALVEPQPTPLAAALGESVGALVAGLHRAEGVDVRTGVSVAEVHGRDGVETVLLTDGTEIAADLVVAGIGSTPVTRWLAGSGVEVADGVVCDAVGRTGVAGVFAVGDVASWRDAAGAQRRVEHWSNVAEQARLVAAAITGSAAPARGVVPYIWSDQYDLKIVCLGRPAAGDTVHLVNDDGRRFFAYYERDGVVTAAVGAGMPELVQAARGRIGASIVEVLAPA